MPSTSRWQAAQKYEQAFWEGVARQIVAGTTGHLDGTYQWKAQEMERHLQGVLPEEDRAKRKVLEVGCGPVGIVGFLSWGERHAVDPLNDFYQANEALSRFRDPKVNYQTAMGEELPFEDKSFDLVLLQNVLDHVKEADRMLREIHRVLRGDGLFYMTVNVRKPWGSTLHALLSRLLIDKGHPYSFTLQGIREFLHHQGFSIQREWHDDYLEARTIDRRSPALKDKVKGYSGLSEFVFYSVCTKIR